MKILQLLETRLPWDKTKAEILAVQQELIDLLPDDVDIKVANREYVGPRYVASKRDSHDRMLSVDIFWPVRIDGPPTNDGFKLVAHWEGGGECYAATVQQTAKSLDNMFDE